MVGELAFFYLSDLLRMYFPQNLKFLLCLIVSVICSVDEILVGVKGRGLTVEPTYVRDVFSALPLDGVRFKLGMLGAHPCDKATQDDLSLSLGQRATAFHFQAPGRECTWKTFYYSLDFMSTAEGNHGGKLRSDRKCNSSSPAYKAECRTCEHRCTSLAIIHLDQAQSFVEHDNKMTWMAKMRGYVSSELSDPSKCLTHQLGVHYCKYVAERKSKGIAFMQGAFEVKRDNYCKNNTAVFPFLGLSALLKRLVNN